ncbi:TonB-dependent receptor [Aurantivibrio infirmus]
MGKITLLASLTVLSVSAAPSIFAQQSDDTARVNLEEILITASRRSASVQDTAIAVSAVSGEQMQTQQINTVGDLASTLPNVQVTGAFTTANIFIRGIGNSQGIGGAEPGVAFHTDGAYLSQSLLTMSNFLDIERIEVLRGPQGTLFGRNATGGAVNLIANKPTEEFEYGFNLSAGFQPNEIRSNAYVSGSLNESQSVLGRFAFQHSDNEGYTENKASFGPKELDDQKNYSVRGQLEFRPTSNFSSRISVDYQDANNNGPAAYFIGLPDPTQPLPLPLIAEPKGDPEDREIFVNTGDVELEALGISWESLWTFNAGDLKFLAHFNKAEIDLVQDGDGTAFDFTSTIYSDEEDETFAELLFTSDATQAFRYVIGVNYFTDELTQALSVPVLGLPVSIDLSGIVDSTSYAVFTSANLDISDSWEIFGGVRYTNDKKSLIESNNFIGMLEQDDSWSEVTYELGTSVNLSSNIIGYAKYSTGFKSGGYSLGSLSPSFEPETNENLEFGLKGDYLDSRLRANLALFKMNYDDLQVTQVVGVIGAVTNAAEAEVNGFEAELTYLATENLRIDLTAAWLDAKFEKFLTADSARPLLGTLDLSGNTLPGAPKSNASLGFYYDQYIDAGTLTYGARYDWKSKQYFSEFNIPISSQKSVGTTDLSLNFVSESGRWNASVFALNVTDETIKSNVLVVSALLGSLTLAQYQPGRQFGISFGFDY